MTTITELRCKKENSLYRLTIVDRKIVSWYYRDADSATYLTPDFPLEGLAQIYLDIKAKEQVKLLEVIFNNTYYSIDLLMNAVRKTIRKRTEADLSFILKSMKDNALLHNQQIKMLNGCV